MLRANARRPVYRVPVAPDRRRKRRSSSNSHLHVAVAIALATSSLIAVIIPITRTQANHSAPAQSRSAVMNLPGSTGVEAGVAAQNDVRMFFEVTAAAVPAPESEKGARGNEVE